MKHQTTAGNAYRTALVAAMLMYIAWFSWAALMMIFNKGAPHFYYSPAGMVVHPIALVHAGLMALIAAEPYRQMIFGCREQILKACVTTLFGAVVALVVGLWFVALALGVACMAAAASLLPAISRYSED